MWWKTFSKTRLTLDSMVHPLEYGTTLRHLCSSALRGPGVGYQSLPTFSAIFIMNFLVQLPIPRNLSRTIYDTPAPQHMITRVCCGTRRGYVRRYSHFHLTRKIYTEHRKKNKSIHNIVLPGPIMLSLRLKIRNKESNNQSQDTNQTLPS
jgi:hypothetical protein